MKVVRLFGLTMAALLVAAPAALTSMAAGSVDARDAGAKVSTASCQVDAFDTSQSRFRPGLDNQGTVWGNSIEPPNGYWEGAGAAAYAVGFEWEAPYELRNHFTFDLSSLPAGSATGAVLVLRNGNDWSYGPGGLLRLREVVTRTRALNLHLAPPKRVFNDLGTGPVYGAKRIVESTATGPVVRIPLNATGVAAVNAAAGGFFSVGGRLTNPNVEFFSILWRSTSSSQGVQRLLVTTNDCT
jgi:hypothetical protein